VVNNSLLDLDMLQLERNCEGKNVVEINSYEYNDVFRLRVNNNVIFVPHDMKYISVFNVTFRRFRKIAKRD
jgi:hypothetical protein